MEKKNNYLALVLIVTVSILIGVICMLNVNAKNSNEESLTNYELPLLGNESFEEKLNRELASKKSNEDLIYSEVKYVEEIEEIDFSTEYVTDKNMYKDQSKVITEGIKGKELIGYLVKTEYSKDGEKEVDKSIRNSIVIEEPTTKVVKVGTKERPKPTSKPTINNSNNSSVNTITRNDSYNGNFKRDGVMYWSGYRWTYYSETVLPGKGLHIPGRHLEGAFVCDENGYICLASDKLSKGTVVSTPFGKQGKVYDCGVGRNDTLDVYVNSSRSF